MADNDKGFSFRSLFFRDAKSASEEKQVRETPNYINTNQGNFITNSVPSSAAGIPDQSLVEDFVQRLQNLINQNNQSGFDFLLNWIAAWGNQASQYRCQKRPYRRGAGGCTSDEGFACQNRHG